MNRNPRQALRRLGLQAPSTYLSRPARVITGLVQGSFDAKQPRHNQLLGGFPSCLSQKSPGNLKIKRQKRQGKKKLFGQGKFSGMTRCDGLGSSFGAET